MCEPVTIGLVAGAALTAIGGYVDYKNTKYTADANAKIAQNNAVLAEQGAKDEAILSAREQQQAAWETRALIGSQKAALAANMIDSGEGTAFDLIGESALFGGSQQSAIAQDAARKAWGLQSQALNYRNEASVIQTAGKNAGRATILKTIGSLAMSGASAYGSRAAGGSVGGVSRQAIAKPTASMSIPKYTAAGRIYG